MIQLLVFFEKILSYSSGGNLSSSKESEEYIIGKIKMTPLRATYSIQSQMLARACSILGTVGGPQKTQRTKKEMQPLTSRCLGN